MGPGRAAPPGLADINSSRAWQFIGWWERVKGWFRTRQPNSARPGAGQTLTVAAGQPAGRVSIIIPFKNHHELLHGCLKSLRASTYRRFELVLVDNGSTERRTQRYVQGLEGRRGLRVLRRPGPFNFSRLCNEGARRASGDYLLFLNNDMEVLSADWLEHLLLLERHPEVGVVGGTLLYPDGTIQHAGIFRQADGLWVHGHRGGSPDDGPIAASPSRAGRHRRLPADRAGDVPALGGFDERYPVTFGDVDLCCRVRAAGLLVVVTPHARLLHFESLSRGYVQDCPGQGHLAALARLPVERPPTMIPERRPRMRVSCLCVCHNKPDLTHEAVESIVHQCHPDWEALIVDSGVLYDAGYYEPFPWRIDPRIKLFRSDETDETRRTKAMAPWCYNECFRKGRVTGDLVMYLCDDDLLYPNAFATFVAYCRQHPDAEAMYASQDIGVIYPEGGRAVIGERRATERGGRCCGGRPMDCQVDYLQFCHKTDVLRHLPGDATGPRTRTPTNTTPTASSWSASACMCRFTPLTSRCRRTAARRRASTCPCRRSPETAWSCGRRWRACTVAWSSSPSRSISSRLRPAYRSARYRVADRRLRALQWLARVPFAANGRLRWLLSLRKNASASAYDSGVPISRKRPAQQYA